MREIKEKYEVYGEFGGKFTNAKEAYACAKVASKTEAYADGCEVYKIKTGTWFCKYEKGKCTCYIPLKETK